MSRTRSPRWVLGSVLAVMIWGGGSVASAQFNASTQVTDGSGGFTPPEIVRITNDFIAVGSTTNGTIFSANTAAGLPAVPHLVSPQTQGGISISPGSTFLQYLAYTQVDNSGGPGERDIRIASNPSGPFTVLELVNADDIDDREPNLHFDTSGVRHLAWVAETAPGISTVRYQRDPLPIIDLGDGDFPIVTGIGGSDVVAVYLRTGELYWCPITEVGPQPESLLLDTPADITAFRVTGEGGTLHVVTVEAGALVHRSAPVGSALGAPTTLTAGPIDGAFGLDLDSLGRLVVVWASGGEVFWTRESAGVFPAGAPIGTEPGASDASVVTDSLNFVHVAYLSGGEVWMTNDVPSPVAEFSVQNGTGELPVEIGLVNSSSGVIQFYEWDFGDGTTSSQQNPLKTYTEPGTFDISLTVRGPGGEDTFTVSSAVTTTTPENLLEIADIIAFGGQPVSQPLLASHPDPLQGFQAAIRYNEDVTPFSEVNFIGTGVDSLAPEFVVTNINPNGALSELIIAVIFDFNTPFDGRTLDPGEQQTIANLIYTVPFGNPFGTTGTIEFIDGLGSPPITNRFATVNSESITPYLLHGSCTIDAAPQFVFVRGDANYNLAVDIADAIFLLGFLFSGGASPECPDSADANDDGAINIGDAIYVLGFLFNNGPTIPYPFPGYGIDPSPDSLGVCNPSPTN